MKATFMPLVLMVAMGCSGTEPDGIVDVSGQVTNVSGQPVAGTTVAIACPRIAFATTVTTDAGGHYAANLHAPSAGKLFQCSFGVPNLNTPLARVDTLIGFAEGLHALQFVDLKTP